MSEAMRRIEKLWHDAQTCNDPKRLREIAAEQQELGQWLDSRWTKNKAHDIERRYAEAAQK
jgi:hypothetical protein